jgi:DNA-directed RNA polymerase subunit K/omega
MKAKEQFHPEDFIENSDSIYEAVLIIARRARQIGELQKRRIDRHLGQTEMLEQAAARARAEEGDDAVEPEPLDRTHIQFEKPVVLSLKEMIAGEIDYHYEE